MPVMAWTRSPSASLRSWTLWKRARMNPRWRYADSVATISGRPTLKGVTSEVQSCFHRQVQATTGFASLLCKWSMRKQYMEVKKAQQEHRGVGLMPGAHDVRK